MEIRRYQGARAELNFRSSFSRGSTVYCSLLSGEVKLYTCTAVIEFFFKLSLIKN